MNVFSSQVIFNLLIPIALDATEIVQFKLADIGEGIAEVQLTEW